ncbi:MAG: hypothetical protein QY318_03320 [Candidatus Dojkabacteria bacterium]|nr:MAG: hypothetical protein QY318_03320 [Candidatus Dojkabacteria bacterium]
MGANKTSTMGSKIVDTRIEKALLLGLFITFLILVLYKTYLITDSSDFLNRYKYFTPDSYDWIVNGIYQFRDDKISYRSSGLPLLIKPLWDLNLLWLLPFINAVTFIGLIFTVNRSVNFWTKNYKLAIFLSIILFLNFELQEFSKYILADLYAVLFLAASVYFISTSRPNKSFLFLGVSALFQSFAFFVFPAWIAISCLDLLLSRKKHRTLAAFTKEGVTEILSKTFMFLFPLLPVMIYKAIKFGNPLYTSVGQFDLLKPNVDSVFYYSVSLVDIYTLPILLLGLLGIFYYIYRRQLMQYRYILSGLLVATIFWVVIYDWNDKRFMLYLLPFIYILAGDGLNFLIRSLEKYKDIRGGILTLITLAVVAQGMTPAADFFTSNELVIFPNLKYTFKNEFVDGKGMALKRSGELRQLTYKELVQGIPYISEYTKTEEHKTVPNSYAHHAGLVDKRFDPAEKEFCVNEGDIFDYYSLNSITKIKTGYTLGDLTIVYNCQY